VPEPTFDELLEAMRRGIAVLKTTEVPFVLGGGLAGWARGGPKSEHDVDFLLRSDDVATAVRAFERAGYPTEDPPEGWLRKAYVDGVLIDLIFHTSEGPIDDALIERAPELEVDAVLIRVAPLEDVLVAKLLAITEQKPDYSDVLELARSLREQIDWDAVRARSARSPFGRAFFTLVDGLGIVGDPPPAGAAS
jgi:predicted nucleotidyltransferase